MGETTSTQSGAQSSGQTAIQTTRFGEVKFSQSETLEFAEGLLGFGPLRRFILLDDPNDEIFAWLQSCENAEIAFPVLEPELFTAQYKIELSKSDLEALQLESLADGRCLTIITIPVDPTQMTANMKAPIVLNPKKKIARQCVLQDNSLQIREPIFSKLQQRVVQNPSASFKVHSVDIGAVKVSRPPSPPHIEV
jgi:flagellar assembly factor FliW